MPTSILETPVSQTSLTLTGLLTPPPTTASKNPSSSVITPGDLPTASSGSSSSWNGSAEHLAEVRCAWRSSLYALELENVRIIQRSLHPSVAAMSDECPASSFQNGGEPIVKVWRFEANSIHVKVVVPDLEQWDRRYTVAFGFVGPTGKGHLAVCEEVWEEQKAGWRPSRILSAPTAIGFYTKGLRFDEPFRMRYALKAVQDCLRESIKDSLRPEWFNDGMCQTRDARIKKAFTLAEEMIFGEENEMAEAFR
jgi:hypothetical protein